ncbi:hypothetical protein ACTXGW_11170 [Psychrobacter faecalis]
MMIGLSFNNQNGDVCLLAAPEKAVKIRDKMVECNMSFARHLMQEAINIQ